MNKLDSFEKDALGELINIAMGSAAEKLSELSGNEVHMSVPSVELVTVEKYKKVMRDGDSENLISVSEKFTGGFSGNAGLIFYFNKSINLIKSLMPDIVHEDEFTDLEEEVLTEVGNILLNSCISTFANILKKEFHTDIPRFNKGTVEDILNIQHGVDSTNYYILLAEVEFFVQSKEISGHVGLTLTLPVLRSLLDELYLASGITEEMRC